MKRTKQTYWRQFPTQQGTVESSGCREFQGQDLKYDARRQFFKAKQKQWLDQQMEEKLKRKQQEKYEEKLYAIQTQELNRMRGMLEDNFLRTKSNILQSHVKTNQQLDFQKKEKERLEKERRLKEQREEVEYLKERGTKQDFYMQVK